MIYVSCQKSVPLKRTTGGEYSPESRSSPSNSWNADRAAVFSRGNFEGNALVHVKSLRLENAFNVKQVRYLPGIEWAIVDTVNIQVKFCRHTVKHKKRVKASGTFTRPARGQCTLLTSKLGVYTRQSRHFGVFTLDFIFSSSLRNTRVEVGSGGRLSKRFEW